jgi:hypothetical protein
MLHTQAFYQHSVDEFGSTEFAETLIERQAQHLIDAFGSQQFQLVAQACQTGRRGGGREELTRLRLENNHATGQTQFDSTIPQARQNSLVASVNTVKVANGGDATPMAGKQIVKASNQLHNALLAHKVADYNHTRPWTTGNTPRQNNSRPPMQGKIDDCPLDTAYITALRAKSFRRKPSARSMAK